MRKIIIRTLTVMLVSWAASAWAANYSNPVEGIFKGVYGNAITVEVPSLVSKSPVSNEDQNGALSFAVNASTHYNNFNQLTDLKDGDSVRVGYNEDPSGKTKQMTAETITKIEPEVVTNPADATDTAVEVPTPPTTQTVTTTTTTQVGSQ